MEIQQALMNLLYGKKGMIDKMKKKQAMALSLSIMVGVTSILPGSDYKVLASNSNDLIIGNETAAETNAVNTNDMAENSVLNEETVHFNNSIHENESNTETAFEEISEYDAPVSYGNGTENSNWEIYSEDSTTVTLGKYLGSEKEIIVPPEIDGKQVYVYANSTEFPADMTSIKFESINGKKVKVSYIEGLLQGYTSLVEADISGLDIQEVTSLGYYSRGNYRGLFSDCTSLAKIIGLDTWDVSSITNMQSVFYNCRSLQEIKGVENWDTSKVTHMSCMFTRCDSLTNIAELANWNTSKVVDMQYLFYDCNNLSDISPLQYWNISKVENLYQTFFNTAVNDVSALQNWDTSNVIDMSSTFMWCRNLNDITGLTNWNTSKVTKMGGLFSGCSLLSNIEPLTAWNVSSVTKMGGVFNGCPSLSNIEPLTAWDVSSVSDMGSMFSNCKSLHSLTPLAAWNTSKVTTMGNMFSGCTSLTDLSPIKNWNVTSVIYMNYMFADCSSLEIADLGTWDTPSLINMEMIFYDNPSLRIVNLEHFNLNKIESMDSLFAFYDSVDPIPSILIIARDEKLKEYNYIADSRTPVGPTFNGNEGTFSDNSTEKKSVEVFVIENTSNDTINQILEQAKTSIEVPSRENYNFNGWSSQQTESLGENISLSVLNKLNTTFYAQWAAIINNAPAITASDKVLTVGDDFDPLAGVTAYDDEDGVITLTDADIIANDVNINEAGTYSITYKVTDSQGVSSIKTITIVVNPKLETINKLPVITASDKVLTVGDDFDPLAGVTAYDDEDGVITLTDADVVTNDVDMSNAGTYSITYKVTDSQGASSIKTITVVVNPKLETINKLPIITASDKVLTVGDDFDPLTGITVYDDEDGVITLTNSNIIANNVDMTKAGTYFITYIATDSQGASSIKTITVIVKEKEENKESTTPNKTDNGNSNHQTSTTPAATYKPINKQSGSKLAANKSIIPQTRDTTSLFSWISTLALSGGLLGMLGRKRRKNHINSNK
jgi:uncharacterized repeat protein (TIGR02543 family)